MDTGVLLAILIFMILVVGVNAALVLLARRNNMATGIRLWRKALRRARNPWEPENKDLEELSRLVDSLKDQDK
jgi:hypothetical protein